MKKYFHKINENIPLLIFGLVALVALVLVVKTPGKNITGNTVIGCFDSDSDQNFFVKGYVEYRKDRFYDYCDGNKLFQYYCKSSVATSRIHGYQCPYGCNNGKCLSPQDNCGDGILNVGERCDDGNDLNRDGCSDTCEIEIGFSCNPISVCNQN